MAKIPVGKDGIPMRKPIPASKKVCPYGKTHPTTSRMVGMCHEAKIIGIMGKMAEDETVIDLMKRRSRITLELDCNCPLFETCKLQAKVETQIRVTKDEDGIVVSKTSIPVKRIKTQDELTDEEWEKAFKLRRKLKKKNPAFVGKSAKKNMLRGRKRQSSFKDAEGNKVLIN